MIDGQYALPELLVAKDIHSLDIVGRIGPTPESVEAQTAEDKATQLPTPATFHLLCVVPDTDEAFDSGILKADKTKHYEELMTAVLFVVAVGPDAYQDKARFPTGPACRKGDFVLVRPNTGTRLKIHGREFRLIADDSVQATVLDPRGIARP
jgi:co-chaperonin GroES (HSP10)